jgi:hypothetical protein
MDERLAQMADSHEKLELISKRDHAVAKFPVFPVDLSIWMIAYFEDWMRDYRRVAMPVMEERVDTDHSSHS